MANVFTEFEKAVMKQPEITIRIVLNRGDANDTVWTCDFSYDYVKIKLKGKAGSKYISTHFGGSDIVFEVGEVNLITKK